MDTQDQVASTSPNQVDQQKVNKVATLDEAGGGDGTREYRKEDRVQIHYNNSVLFLNAIVDKVNKNLFWSVQCVFYL